MKEKKSNLKNNNVSIEDEQKTSLTRLIGLFLIVYSILCYTSSDIGCALSVPFSFLFGSFTPIALLIVAIMGIYMLMFKKVFNSFSTIQYILISLIILFSLTLATATEPNQTMTFSTCFGRYIGRDGIYRWNYRFLLANKENSITQLGGGMIGYMIYGIINSITSQNYTITIVISWIILGGTIFIFLAPYIAKVIRFIKKIYKKSSEKRAERKKMKKEKQEKEEQLRQEKLKEEKAIEFNLQTENNSENIDDLLETTEINITGDNYNYFKSSNKKDNKLSNILSSFDVDIYPETILNPKSSTVNDFSSEVRLTDIYSEDFAEIEKGNKENKDLKMTSLNTQNMDSKEQQMIQDEIQLKPTFEADKNVKLENIHESFEIKENNEKQIEIEEKVQFENLEDVLIKENNAIDEKNANLKNKNLEKGKETVDFNEIPYELPPLYLLKDASDNGANAQNEEVAKEKAEILMEKMRELNVSATINAFVVGPSVTRFEIALAPGVRVGSFTNLQEDFKLALGVNSIRIESPIPGKSAIGIEVPNLHRAMVSMKEIITKMPNKKQKLYVPVGKDITGTPLSFPICDMPHCLISGATNSGKSVCANTIILSILMNYKPSEVRLIMVDPKRVEMLFYKDIPHLLCPIITESEKARVALDKLCLEMDKRFTIFSKVGVKNIASYNEFMVANGNDKMPFILLVVDEFAELMLCKNHNIVEEKIQKLAQLGRAAGIHLILSTQRPDVNVIPGTIKTNLPCRMTFRLSSLVDSRTVIDVGGAEKLLNNGDMLLLTPDFTGLRRVQGVYVSDKEISDVVEYCKKQAGPQYDPNFLDLRTEEEKAEDEKLKYALSGNNNNENDFVDSLFEEIKCFVIKEGKASTSFLQRKFGIGYSKAARYIDMLEENGIVGPENGSKPREVLITNKEQINDDES